MASTRDIKKRIKGVHNIQQITRTMEMVAAAKLRKTQAAAQNAKPYAAKIREMMFNIGSSIDDVKNSLLQARPVKKIALLVVTSNRGLCGAFNSNIFRKTEEILSDRPDGEFLFFCAGKKGRDHFGRRDQKIIGSYLPSDKLIEPDLIAGLAGDLTKGFEREEYDEVILVFSEFVSPMVQKPTAISLLPIRRPESEASKKEYAGFRYGYIFEPGPEELMAELIPQYMHSQIHNAVAQSQAGEQASRLIAMKSATDNAKDMIQALTLTYNKARQSGITTEILEIVAGAEAIKAG